jgi:dienelactone hydrolase
MKIRILAVVGLLAGTLLLSACAAGVQFKGFSTTSRKEITLEGTLYKPEGRGPFPAIVLMHNCSGINEPLLSQAWKIHQWGYVVLVMDSFGPRNITETCSGKSSIAMADRAMDAHSGKAYLAGLPFVDPKKVAIIGWSYGATTTINALNPKLVDALPLADRRSFRAAAAYYPNCNITLDKLQAPLLILIGEKDDWTSADLCRQKLPPPGKGSGEVILKIYPGAYHSFDRAGLRAGHYFGHYLAHDAQAEADASQQLHDFLTRHLK